MIQGIDVVFLHVKNPEKMAKWYKDKLGLEISFKTEDLSWQEFSLENNTKTRFALDYAGKESSEVERQSIIISFKVSDIYSMVDQLEKKGVEFWGRNKIINVGLSLIATFKDPEDNFLQLSQRKE